MLGSRTGRAHDTVGMRRVGGIVDLAPHFPAGGVSRFPDAPWARHPGAERAIFQGHEAPLQDVELATLRRTQDHVTARPWDDDRPQRSAPVVVRHQGADWLVDGHHRAMHEIEQGATHLRAHVTDLDTHHTAAREAWYHGTRHELSPGQELTGGHMRSNQGAGQPGAHVYYSGRRDVASFFGEAASGPEHDYDARPRLYKVTPLDGHEPDPDEHEDFQSFRAPRVRVDKEVPFDHKGLARLYDEE